MRTTLLLASLFLLLGGAAASAGSGVKGRIAWQGELVPGITVRAYRAIPDIAAGKAVAVSPASALDGTYALALPPGDYYLTAQDYAGAPVPGKHFCYYSGAPVQVSDGAWVNVGFNLIRIPAEGGAQTGQGSGIRGEITFQGEPLEQCYLYVYNDAGHDFRGPAWFVQPVADGRFRLRLPPGDYWLLARKRAQGGQFGPIEIGDYFNYYHGNPVRIEAGQTKEVRIETITRLSMLEEEPPPFRGVTGKVVGPGGQPAGGVRVFAYREPAMTGTPAHFSPPTDGEGRFHLPLPGNGPWHLLARQSFGGPAGEGEWYGKYRGDGQAVTLQPKETSREVTIHVERKDRL